MLIDASTITLAGGLVAFVSGVFLLVHWRNFREDAAAFSWGAASCAMGIGISMLAMHSVLSIVFSTIVAPLILDASTFGIWAAARIFNRGSVAWRALIIVTGVWIAMLMAIGATGLDWLAAASGVGMSACLTTSAAIEFWLARAERLRGRVPMIAVLSLEAISLFLVTSGVFIHRSTFVMPSIGGFGLIHFVGLIFAGGSAISLVTMLKDRSEARYKTAALVDPLTNLANRRAFMERAQFLFDVALRDKTPFSLLAFDLDRFKNVNDTFGHPTGDHVLRIFADTISKATRPADIAGRVGGEEFALALPDCAAEAALHAARRIRSAFQDDARYVNGRAVGGTVSVGVATAPEHGGSLAEIIASADHALYRAKDAGRNRVMLAAHNSSGPANVIRIA